MQDVRVLPSAVTDAEYYYNTVFPACYHGKLGGWKQQSMDHSVWWTSGEIFRNWKQSINAQLQAFYNVVVSEEGPDWILRFQLQFFSEVNVQSGKNEVAANDLI